MKRVLIVLTVAACSVFLAAGAMAYPGPNSIGLYTATDATGPVETNVDWDAGNPYTPVNAYLCLTNLEVPSLVAFECEVEVVTSGTPLIFPNWTLVGGINAADTASGKFFVAFQSPINPNPQGVYHVATWATIVTAADSQAELFIKAYEVPSLPGDFPVFINGENPGDKRIAFVAGGGPTLPSFTVNGPGAVPNDDTTWGSMKTLFR